MKLVDLISDLQKIPLQYGDMEVKYKSLVPDEAKQNKFGVDLVLINKIDNVIELV